MHEKENSIDIVENKLVDPVFTKANAQIIEKYKKSFSGKNFSEKLDLLSKFWKIEYKADIVFNDSQPKYIIFDNALDKTMFLLKWR